MRFRPDVAAVLGTVLIAGVAWQAASGNLVFAVTNDGKDVTEFYLMSEDGLRIVGEVENIAPGLTRNLVVQAAPGSTPDAKKRGRERPRSLVEPGSGCLHPDPANG